MLQKIVILGNQGMLGQEIENHFLYEKDKEVVGLDKNEIDVTDFVSLSEKLLQLKPAIIINCVAYNDVDKCEEDESEYAKALLLNRDLPRELARIANTLDALLVHYSTDYVFDGSLEEKKAGGGCGNSACCGGGCHSGGERGYGEGAFPNPLSRYGQSKALGETEVLMTAKKYYLIRLSKLFGKPAKSMLAKKSFFEKMLAASETQKEVGVVDDEKSNFTYAPDLALATIELIADADPYGIYHLTNSGAATWFEATKELYRLADKETEVKPLTAEEFSRPAARPHFSPLINTKRPPLRRYEVALAEYLADTL